MPCPDENALLSFVAGGADDLLRATLESHLDTCAGCRTVVAELAEPQEPAPGLSFGRYRIDARLGAGAMGVVFRARDTQLDRDVALKVLKRDNTTDTEQRERLRREARAMARLDHPNIVGVYDVGEEDEWLYVAMELGHGTTAADWHTREKPSLEAILRVFIQAGRGLEAAHQAGLVHRDFKPRNILVDPDGRVRVTDFGLSRVAGESLGWGRSRAELRTRDGGTSLDSADSSGTSATNPLLELTRTGVVLGTPAYMAPEQFEGHADAKSDQFSFCVALSEAVSGARPWKAASLEELRAVLQTPPAITAKAPKWLRDVLLKGLSRNPEHRFSSMSALLRELERSRLSRRALFGIGAATLTALAIGILKLFPSPPPQPVELQLRVDESRQLEIREMKRVSLEDASVAQVDAQGANRLLIKALRPGATRLHVWSGDGARQDFELTVVGE